MKKNSNSIDNTNSDNGVALRKTGQKSGIFEGRTIKSLRSGCKIVMRHAIKNIFLLVLIVISVGISIYFWNDARSARRERIDAQDAQNLQETEEVIQSLSSVLLIEQSTQPTVARVENPEVLRNSNQAFYKNVEIGDHLVLYADRAIIYRLKDEMIINISPIVDTSNSDQQPAGTAGIP